MIPAKNTLKLVKLTKKKQKSINKEITKELLRGKKCTTCEYNSNRNKEFYFCYIHKKYLQFPIAIYCDHHKSIYQ